MNVQEYWRSWEDTAFLRTGDKAYKNSRPTEAMKFCDCSSCLGYVGTEIKNKLHVLLVLSR